MKALKLAGLGFAIWTLSLMWPEINQILGPTLMIGMTLALGIIAVVYALVRRFGNRQSGHHSGQDHSTRPIPMIATH
jgi:hypothetical protein